MDHSRDHGIFHTSQLLDLSYLPMWNGMSCEVHEGPSHIKLELKWTHVRVYVRVGWVSYGFQVQPSRVWVYVWGRASWLAIVIK